MDYGTITTVVGPRLCSDWLFDDSLHQGRGEEGRLPKHYLSLASITKDQSVLEFCILSPFPRSESSRHHFSPLPGKGGNDLPKWWGWQDSNSNSSDSHDALPTHDRWKTWMTLLKTKQDSRKERKMTACPFYRKENWLYICKKLTLLWKHTHNHLLFFHLFIIILFMSALPTSISVCHIHDWCPRRPKEGLGSSETGVTDGY